MPQFISHQVGTDRRGRQTSCSCMFRPLPQSLVHVSCWQVEVGRHGADRLTGTDAADDVPDGRRGGQTRPSPDQIGIDLNVDRVEPGKPDPPDLAIVVGDGPNGPADYGSSTGSLPDSRASCLSGVGWFEMGDQGHDK